MSKILEICKNAKETSFKLANVSTIIKDNALKKVASNILKNQDIILKANNIDVENAKNKGISGALLDRLTLTPQRVKAMAEGLVEIAGLPDPIGEVVGAWKRPNGLEIGQKRVPIGVVGVIYEARPNVTADVAGLTLKSGNCAVLKGGSEAINSNMAIIEQITDALRQEGISEHAVQLVTDTNREATVEMLKMDKYIDVLIPRGGEGLKKIILEHSSIPVIMATAGNCHVYVDSAANLEMAKKIVINSKTQRPGVCNAMETLLVNKDIAENFIPEIIKLLHDEKVEIRGCEITRKYVDVNLADESDWSTEYLDLILAVKVVDSFDDATEHINKYGTRHSEAIITEDYETARRFHDVVDAAAVYVNASTRFTDGFEFGFGAEIGISNQKLHARGPIGLKQLTTLKYIIYGSGQIR